MDIKKKYCLTIVFVIYYTIAHAQVQEENNLDQWYKMVNRAISPDANWSLFYKLYDARETEAILLNNISKITEIYKDPVDAYLDDDLLLMLSKDQILDMKNLKNNTKKQMKGIRHFNYYRHLGKILIITSNDLLLIDKNGQTLAIYNNAKIINYTPDSKLILIEKDARLMMINLLNKHSYPIGLDTKDNKIIHASIENDVLRLILEKKSKLTLINFNAKGQITEEKKLPLSYTSDMQFGNVGKDGLSISRPHISNPEILSKDIELWDSADPVLYPKRALYQNNAKIIDFINLKTGTSVAKNLIKEEHTPQVVFDNKFLLWVSDLSNVSFDRNNVSPLPAIELIDISTQNTVLKVSKSNLFYSIPTMHCLLYFSEKHWWIYDINTGQNNNITERLGTDFHYYDRLNVVYPHPVAKAYCNVDFSKIYLTDTRNVWEYDILHKKATIISEPSPDDVSYTIVNQSIEAKRETPYDIPVINGSSILLKSTQTNQRKIGLSIWHNQRLITIVNPTDKAIGQIQYSDKAITFSQENANLPNMLLKYDFTTQKLETLFRSNEALFRAEAFPKSFIFEWENEQKDIRDVMVILPLHYNPQKKYPVIVNIYENKVKDYLQFVYPSFYNEDGFNRTLMAVNGYIVVLPHIYYKADQVGESAKASVEEALIKLQKIFSLDMDNIGLIGHSFGGYQTNYIMTKSKMFKTAISGSSLADITADYFAVHDQFLQSNVSRYTDLTFGFSKTFYANKEAYFKNNPVFAADAIESPMLLWTGKEDYHVNWKQSISMYTALASQKKPVRLMLFKNDAHSLLHKENQYQATYYFLDWFNHFLK